jgi:hypothetical protein
MYCTVESVRDIPIIKEQQTLREETISEYIGQAQMYIDMICRKKGFTEVPFTDVPAEIEMICKKLTVCFMLREVKSLMNVEDSNMYAISDYCKEAFKLLDGVQQGKLNITDPEIGEEHPGGALFYQGIDHTSDESERPWI